LADTNGYHKNKIFLVTIAHSNCPPALPSPILSLFIHSWAAAWQKSIYIYSPLFNSYLFQPFYLKEVLAKHINAPLYRGMLVALFEHYKRKYLRK